MSLFKELWTIKKNYIMLLEEVEKEHLWVSMTFQNYAPLSEL